MASHLSDTTLDDPEDHTDLNLEQSLFQDLSKFGIFDDAPCHPDQYGVLAGHSLHDLVTENLNEQIRELRDVNARLTNTVREKDHVINQLRQRIPSASGAII
jgi:hypothetical protein